MTLTLDQCLQANPSSSLLAHMWPICNSFLYPLWKCVTPQGTHLELCSRLIIELKNKRKEHFVSDCFLSLY